MQVLLLLSTLFVIMCIDVAVLGSQQEGNALRMFITSADPQGKVATQWGGGEDPCGTAAWLGVECAGVNKLNVTSLILDNMNLTGFIPDGTLSQLTELRILSLSGNGLTGKIPADLIKCVQLKHLYMQDNALSGSIPSPLSNRLKRIDLSNNKLSGPIPSSLADIEGLLSLFLDSNMLEGVIPPLNQQTLVQFNVSNNNLSGEIPSAISSRSFSANVFVGNPLLCGAPLHDCTVQLSPEDPSQKAAQKKLTTGQIVAIILASIAFVLIALCSILCYYKRRCVSKGPQNRVNMKVVPTEREDFQSVSTASAGDEDKPRLVFFEETNTFGLENLLRASAELLGKGSLGCAYKAVLEDGRAMCVKRLKELNNVARSEFEQQMQLVGRLRHPNVVPLWAYYYAKEEKLLVYEYQANGNLHHLLLAGEQRQGNGTLKPLSWNARLRIAKGIAKGLAYLHHEYESKDIPHGNIKASNILIGKDYEARVADFGLASLLTSLSLDGKPPRIQAPELNVSRQATVTQKEDVYSFGVLLLELLTGRVTQENEDDDSCTEVENCGFNLPQWVTSVVKEEWSAEVFDRTLMASTSSEESLIDMLQIAMACTSKAPDQRPHMTQVHKMIADIHEEAHSASSTSISVERAPFQFMSSDDSTMISTQSPFYDDHDASFRF